MPSVIHSCSLDLDDEEPIFKKAMVKFRKINSIQEEIHIRDKKIIIEALKVYLDGE